MTFRELTHLLFVLVIFYTFDTVEEFMGVKTSVGIQIIIDSLELFFVVILFLKINNDPKLKKMLLDN